MLMRRADIASQSVLIIVGNRAETRCTNLFRSIAWPANNADHTGVKNRILLHEHAGAATCGGLGESSLGRCGGSHLPEVGNTEVLSCIRAYHSHPDKSSPELHGNNERNAGTQKLCVWVNNKGALGKDQMSAGKLAHAVAPVCRSP